jgi:acylglycerol lipase
LVLVHGMGEHSGRYMHVIEHFNKHNISVFTFDLPGHGKTSGQRGFIKKFSDFTAVIDVVCKDITENKPAVPLVLMGHSMGGNIIANYLIKGNYTPTTAVIASPWFQLAFKPPFLKYVLAKIANLVFPSLQQTSKLELDAISKDRQEVQKYIDDPLNHDYITPRLFIEVQQAGFAAIRKAHTIKIPLLVYHGNSDTITSCKSTKWFFSRLGSRKESKLILYPSGFHELHNEPNKEEVLNAITDYLKQYA